MTYSKVTETISGLEVFTSALVRDGIVLITDTPDKEVFMEFGEKTGMLPVASHYGYGSKLIN